MQTPFPIIIALNHQYIYIHRSPIYLAINDSAMVNQRDQGSQFPAVAKGSFPFHQAESDRYQINVALGIKAIT